MNFDTDQRKLNGRNVVITRPPGQGGKLLTLLSNCGAEVFDFPVIEIKSLNPGLPDNILDFDTVIVISANAAHHAHTLLSEAQRNHLQIVSIGHATSTALTEAGITVNLEPDDFSSEGLIQKLRTTGDPAQRFLIVRGKGGREHLANTIRCEGGKVEYFECYQRVLASSNPLLLDSIWSTARPCTWIVSSVEGLKNLHQLIDPCYHPTMHQHSLVVLSKRIAQAAHDIGWGPLITVTKQAGDDQIVGCM